MTSFIPNGNFVYCRFDIDNSEFSRNATELVTEFYTEGVFSPEHDGVKTEFILIKKYSCGNNVHYRPILYPDINSLKIYQGTTEIPPSEYIVAPGKIVFSNPPPNIPKLTWEGTFKVLCHFEEDKLDYQPITKNRDNAIFSIPKLILRESRIEPEIALLPSDVFYPNLNHDFNLNLTKRCTISPKFETNIISLSSGETKRFSRRNIPSDISSLQQRKTLSQKDIDYLIALWLCAKGSGSTFRYPDLVNGLSILSRLNSVSLSYQNQTSLQIYSLGELQIRRFTEGIRQDSGLEDSFANPVLTLCYCVLVELTNGEKLGYTNFSQDLKIGGVVFRAKQALDPTAIEKQLGIQSDNQEYRGAFSDNIDENLLFSDRFREARIITAIINWQYPPNSLLDLPDEQIQIGYVGEIKSLGGESYTLENLTASSINLRQSRDEKTSPFCQWAFGQDNGDNSGCRKQVPFYETQVAGVNSRRDFEVWGEYQNLAWGKCTFTDGANKSATYAIYRTVPIFGGKTQIQLFTEASGPVATHDGVILTAGCDKTYNTCKNTWNNTINFGNIPSFGNFMPGNDFLLSSPKQS
jgi:uncharacterized phage protein (TIGR02218 family)